MGELMGGPRRRRARSRTPRRERRRAAASSSVDARAVLAMDPDHLLAMQIAQEQDAEFDRQEQEQFRQQQQQLQQQRGGQQRGGLQLRNLAPAWLLQAAGFGPGAAELAALDFLLLEGALREGESAVEAASCEIYKAENSQQRTTTRCCSWTS